jgi:hypothetical protein
MIAIYRAVLQTWDRITELHRCPRRSFAANDL